MRNPRSPRGGAGRDPGERDRPAPAVRRSRPGRDLEIGFEICIEQCQIGAEGNGPGELELSTRPALDCRGALYVVDSRNHRVQKFGEPGTARPPCPETDQGTEPPPSNEFSFGKLKKNKKKGTAKLIVRVPAPASSRSSGRGGSSAQARASGRRRR
ncbi:MAG: hypothetical protein ACRDL3_06760 [Solirubrobacterales bacterium]